MANNNGTVNIDLIINAANAATTIGEQKKALKELNQALTEVREGSGAFELLSDAANNLRSNMDTLTLSFEDVYGEGTRPLNTQLGELEDRMYAMARAGQQNTEEFRTLQQEAIQMRRTIQDVDASVDAFAQRGARLNAFIGVANGIVAGFGLAQGTMALFGSESEEVEKTLVKLNAVMVILNSLQEIQALVTERNIIVQKALNLVMKANPVLLIVAGFTALVGVVYALTKNVGDNTAALKAQNTVLEFQNQLLDYQIEKRQQYSDSVIRLAEAEGKSIQDIAKLKLDALNASEVEDKKVLANLEKQLNTQKALRSKYIFDGDDEKQQETQTTIDELNKQKDALQKNLRDQNGLGNKYAIERKILATETTNALKKEETERLKNAKDTQNKITEANKKAAEERLKIAQEETAEYIKLRQDYIRQLDNLYALENSNRLNERVKILNDAEQTQNAILEKTKYYKTEIDKLNKAYANGTKYNGEIIKDLEKFEYQRQLIITDSVNKLNSVQKKYWEASIDAEQNLIDLLEEKEKLEDELNIRKKLAVDALTKYETIANKKQLDILKADAIKNEEDKKKYLESVNESYREDELDAYKKLITEQKKEIVAQEELALHNFKGTEEEKALIVSENNAKILKLDQDLANKEAELSNDTVQKEIENEELAFQKRQAIQQKLLAIQAQISNDIVSRIKAESDLRIAAIENEKQARLDAYDEQVQAEEMLRNNATIADYQALARQREIAQNKAAIEEEFNAKVREEKRRQFEADKHASAIQATIAGAVAFVEALPNYILAGIIAGSTIAQVGIIESQPTPAFATGGIVTGPGGPKDDKVNAKLSAGESVINAKSTAMFAPLLSKINEIGGGVKFADSSKVTLGDNNILPNNDMEDIKHILANFANKPILTYVDSESVTIAQKNKQKIDNRRTF